MRPTFRAFTISLGVLLRASVALASPGWVEEPPSDDGEYKYYVGRSAPALNEAQAFREAMKDATEQAVRSNFGMTAEISSESYQTEKDVRGNSRVIERSKTVRVQGFEQTKQYIDRGASGVTVWVLCRYSKDSIRKEQARLEALTGAEVHEPELSTVGEITAAHQTSLEVTSTPPGARVTVGGEVFGKTPILIRGQFAAGPVSVIVDHPKYESATYDVVLVPGEVRKVSSQLVRARGQVNIFSSPPGAKVEIDGTDYGYTPLYRVELEAGSDHEVRLSHPTAERVTQVISVARSMTRDFSVNLPLKPGRLAYKFEPADAKVRLNSMEAQPQGALQLSPGKHRLFAQREGFLDYEKEIVLAPGEEVDLREIRMVTVSEEAKRLERSPWLFGCDFGLMGSPTLLHRSTGVGLGCEVGKRFFGRLTLSGRIGHVGHTGGADYGASEYEHEISITELQITGMFRLFSGFHFLVERGQINGRYKFNPGPYALEASQETPIQSPLMGVGFAIEGEKARLSATVRKYPDTGQNVALVRIGFLMRW